MFLELLPWIMAHEETRKLYWALRSRVLTDAEMQRVESYDWHLAVEYNKTYNEQEKRAEFNAALLQQFRLRLEAERNKAK